MTQSPGLCPALVLTCDLIPIVPPRHDPGLVMCVLTQPEVRLTKVIKNVARTSGKEGETVRKIGGKQNKLKVNTNY